MERKLHSSEILILFNFSVAISIRQFVDVVDRNWADAGRVFFLVLFIILLREMEFNIIMYSIYVHVKSPIDQYSVWMHPKTFLLYIQFQFTNFSFTYSIRFFFYFG